MADAPGTIRRIEDPQAEVERLARERQASAGQICAEEERSCVDDCWVGSGHCVMIHRLGRERTHDPAHCDRAWRAAHA